MLIRALVSLALLAGSGASQTFAASPAPASNVLEITLDQAKVERVPTGTATLIIGNPAVADVTMLKGGVGMVITAKGYGQTNLIALDNSGVILDERQVRVDPAHTVLVVQRGDARASYSCNPWCMPSAQLGDDAKVFSEIGGQVQMRNGWAQGAPK